MTTTDIWKAIQRHLGISVDGIAGPGTARAVARSLGVPVEETKWPKDNDAALIKFYGAPGTGQTSIKLPYPLVIAWDRTQVIERMTCHELCADAFTAVFKNTLDHYGLDRIRQLRLDIFGGCLNVRRKRGGTSWSTHAFGSAIDLDPENNQLRWGRDRATLARPEYEPFWQIVEAQGLVSLGRAANRDFMHFQAATL